MSTDTRMELVSKAEFTGILESIAEDGGQVCELLAGNCPFGWAKINIDFKRFLEDLEVMDFEKAWI